MPSQEEVYASHADLYDRLILREDVDGNILKTIQQILPLAGLDVVDVGAGTGRLARLLGPQVKTLRAYDASGHMLSIAENHLHRMGLTNWETGVADHRKLPAETASADLVISGWSFSYLSVWGSLQDVEAGWGELVRILRPNGMVILLESLGTGNTEPVEIEHLKEFYGWLVTKNFRKTVIRTDYEFESEAEARELALFFFGDSLKVEGTRLPECTGVYWRKV